MPGGSLRLKGGENSCSVLAVWLLCLSFIGPAGASTASCGQLLEAAFLEHWGLPWEGQAVDLGAITARCAEDDVSAGFENDPPGTLMAFIGFSEFVKGRVSAAVKAWQAGMPDANTLSMVALGDVALREGAAEGRIDDGLKKAHAWYRRAAEAGSPLGMSKLAWFYDEGYHVKRDPARALAWYMRAAEAGEPTAMHNLGYFFEAGKAVAKDIETAMRWYEWAGKAGVSASYHNLGVLYDEGLEVPEDDGKAVHYYRLAAYGGHPEAMVNLGWMYRHGAGVERDYGEAIHWYEKAIDAGYDEAATNLGVMYYEGVGVEKDLEAALRYFLLAATAGRPEAMANASSAYMDLGAYRAAYFWTVLATMNGMGQVAFRLVELQALLPDAIMAETEALAAAWTLGSPPPEF